MVADICTYPQDQLRRDHFFQVDQVRSERRQRNQVQRAQDQHEVSIFPDLDFPRRETVEVFALIVKRHRLNTTMIR